MGGGGTLLYSFDLELLLDFEMCSCEDEVLASASTHNWLVLIHYSGCYSNILSLIILSKVGLPKLLSIMVICKLSCHKSRADNVYE